MPGYLAKQAELKAKDVAEVIVFCVNDAAVMQAWAKDCGVDGSMITFYADTRTEFTKALGLEITHAGVMGVLGNVRCKRFSMLVDDGKVKVINIAAAEDDPAGDNAPEVSFVEKLLGDM